MTQFLCGRCRQKFVRFWFINLPINLAIKRDTWVKACQSQLPQKSFKFFRPSRWQVCFQLCISPGLMTVFHCRPWKHCSFNFILCISARQRPIITMKSLRRASNAGSLKYGKWSENSEFPARRKNSNCVYHDEVRIVWMSRECAITRVLLTVFQAQTVWCIMQAMSRSLISDVFTWIISTFLGGREKREGK